MAWVGRITLTLEAISDEEAWAFADYIANLGSGHLVSVFAWDVEEEEA